MIVFLNDNHARFDELRMVAGEVKNFKEGDTQVIVEFTFDTGQSITDTFLFSDLTIGELWIVKFDKQMNYIFEEDFTKNYPKCFGERFTKADIHKLFGVINSNTLYKVLRDNSAKGLIFRFEPQSFNGESFFQIQYSVHHRTYESFEQAFPEFKFNSANREALIACIRTSIPEWARTGKAVTTETVRRMVSCSDSQASSVLNQFVNDKLLISSRKTNDNIVSYSVRDKEKYENSCEESEKPMNSFEDYKARRDEKIILAINALRDLADELQKQLDKPPEIDLLSYPSSVLLDALGKVISKEGK